MNGYNVIEAAVIERFIEYFPELDETRCQGGEMDKVVDAIFEQGADYGCVFEFAGGVHHHSERFNRTVFSWRMAGVIMIRYEEDVIEERLRDIASRLALIFHGNEARLDGESPFVQVVEIEMPEIARVNDIPFYWLPFMVQAVDQ